MISAILEGALDGELDDELGYSKYDYKNKYTKTVVMVTARKLCIQAMEIWSLIFPETVIFRKMGQ